MAHATLSAWTHEQFFAWQERQDDRYELVDGQPLRMMAGASNAHVAVSVNIIVQLGTQLRGKPCRPFHGDGSVQTRRGNIRRPDIGVDCGPFVANGYKATAPRMVAEVLSPSTRDFDTFRKVEEYQLIGSLQRILLIDPNRPEVAVWHREEGGEWEHSVVRGIGETIAMPEIGVALPMAEIYAGIELQADLLAVPAE